MQAKCSRRLWALQLDLRRSLPTVQGRRMPTRVTRDRTFNYHLMYVSANTSSAVDVRQRQPSPKWHDGQSDKQRRHDMQEHQSEKGGRHVIGENRHDSSAQTGSQQVPDFELHRNENGGWRLSAVSDRGLHWIAANFNEWSSGDTVLNLEQANKFLREARKFSLCTSYKGPNGKSVI